jgi:hypothetical protein
VIYSSKQSMQVYDLLKNNFFTSAYLPIAAMIIAEQVSLDDYLRIAQRTRHIYDLMKTNHPFLTSAEDSVFAAMLALSSYSDEHIVAEAEGCYKLLKNEFFSRNAVQSLSHVLALCPGTPTEKFQRTMNLYHGLRTNGCKYSGDYELANLGVLASIQSDTIIQDMADVDYFLSRQRGYGLLGLGRKQRLMHAGMLVASYHLAQTNDDSTHSTDGKLSMQTAAISSTISLIVAQQAAICAAVAASSAAAASANS